MKLADVLEVVEEVKPENPARNPKNSEPSNSSEEIQKKYNLDWSEIGEVNAQSVMQIFGKKNPEILKLAEALDLEPSITKTTKRILRIRKSIDEWTAEIEARVEKPTTPKQQDNSWVAEFITGGMTKLDKDLMFAIWNK